MKVDIYANGLVACSVCAPREMSREDVTKEVNKINPSGVQPWLITKDNILEKLKELR